ncbi:related to 2-polyprenyl-6-methoxyphenol hydroxylase and related FAD-dependent oxidoreductases [Ustilago trichophora]|uniref:Related to 2-polyprenyl-6-methoxyphenol hydroxylase and related FAD-dependent oxidoreductases n=1 Tax=Ustilago trichophora TaxID=86804 RepID=A0A5C3DQT0_9BASI|nr:related to 2-polyprenyl-6-methoxyphenol hydroxylase and related FAD-dependent oxidoreductases [Ustilago trichophora]
MRVLISGAGIAGPTLAFFLSRAGAHVTILEKADSLRCQGQNIDISGTAVSVINKMGLLDEVRRYNTTEQGTSFVDENGKVYASFSLTKSVDTLTSDYEILRGDLAYVLHSATKDHPNIRYRFGTYVTQVLENSQDRVRVKLNSGEEEEYDILVAADGVWSSIRKQAFPEDMVQVINRNNFAIYGTVPRLKEDSDHWCIHQALDGRAVGTRPDNHGTLRAFFSVMPTTQAKKDAWRSAVRSHNRRLQLDLLKSEFKDVGWITPRLLQGMEEADDFHFASIHQIRLSKWYKDRIICLGDTAYAPTPFTGMGTSLAIDGGYLLAGHLSQLSPGQHPAIAFERYESEFKPFVQKIQTLPWYVPGIVHPQYAASRWLFRQFISTVAYIMSIPWLVQMYGSRDERFVEGVVEKLDAPFPAFSAFEAAQTTAK